MININLLPQDMKKRERTPLVLLLPILGGLICVLSAGAVAAYVHFAWLAEVTNNRVLAEQELASKQGRLAYEKRLIAEETEFKKRVSTIEEIGAGRILMTKIIDELCEVTCAGEDDQEEGYLVWIKDLKYTPPSPRTARRGVKVAKSGGTIAYNGYTLADEKPLQHYNWFHAALKRSKLFRYSFNDLADPMGSIEVFADDIEPKKGWTLKQKMDLKDPAESRELWAAAEAEAEGSVATGEDNQPNKSRQGK